MVAPEPVILILPVPVQPPVVTKSTPVAGGWTRRGPQPPYPANHRPQHWRPRQEIPHNELMQPQDRRQRMDAARRVLAERRQHQQGVTP